ncbi:hypothetical protein CHUAL_003184 [Chamberlinius hualienensis]
MVKIRQTNSSEDKGMKYACVKAGASLVKYKPCFSKDSKFIFVAVDSSVRVYSTQTTECVNVFNNDNGEIVSHFLNPQNHLQLITVSSTGSVCYWDYEDAILIREIRLSMEVTQCYSGKEANSLIVLTNNVTGNDEKLQLFLVTIDFKTLQFKKSQLLHLRTGSEEVVNKQIVSLNHDRSVAAIARGNALSLFTSFANAIQHARHLISEKSYFTCLKWHPTGECIATGSHLGIILVWYNYFDRKPIRTKLHWHQLPVVDLEFTSSGGFLYSGGSECVLVKWNLKTEEKQFLPRLGLPICNISCSPDSTHATVSLVENAIVLVNSINKITDVIKGLARTHNWAEFSSAPIPTGILFDKHTSALVLNGKPGHLQFYNIREDKQLYSLDILQENYIHAERNHKIYHLEVIKAAFNKNCNWLATVEYRNDNVMIPELRLKFWYYLTAKKEFHLNTTIDCPHEGYVNSLVFQPSLNKLLATTTSEDGTVRNWSFNEKDDMWNCLSVSFYRHLKAGEACFSEDGSILCVAFANYLTLWLPEENVLRTALWSSSSNEDIDKVQFGRDDCSHILVCSTSDGISAWNTISLMELWHVDFSCSNLVGDPNSSFMAAFENDGNVFIFKPSNPSPISIYKHKSGGKVIAAAFCDRDEEDCSQSKIQHSQLYFMTADQILHTLVDEEPSSNISGSVKKVFGQVNTAMTPFGLLMAEKHTGGTKEVEEKFQELQIYKGKKIIDMVLNTPSHVLPPATELFSAYLDVIIKEKEKNFVDVEEVTEGRVQGWSTNQDVLQQDTTVQSEY